MLALALAGVISVGVLCGDGSCSGPGIQPASDFTFPPIPTLPPTSTSAPMQTPLMVQLMDKVYNARTATNLTIDGGGVRGFIPTEVGLMTAVTVLSAGRIGGPIPSEIGLLTRLEMLYLSVTHAN